VVNNLFDIWQFKLSEGVPSLITLDLRCNTWPYAFLQHGSIMSKVTPVFSAQDRNMG
jgi:hypothetical protein